MELTLEEMLIEWRDARATWEEIEAPKGSNYATWATIRKRYLDADAALLDYAKKIGRPISRAG